ncbi:MULTISPECIES: MarR family winged helix-turn-helix transcriptional regulator [Mycolicibacterium]|jgi:DNA-binding MarR family transcriptional regulator|uniref:Transcriptional regulator n=1 Tax=Mycolicibacterium rhodesiae (strain NBB3) TaxID=710685 RepID=G8RRP3_MYCRN|nr:MarR family transcriptional regulator [Mycolicibacterium rhodesiae]AEV71484.1 transcriptional regulator [Mycolicibacterium rhodesiae NBB3]
MGARRAGVTGADDEATPDSEYAAQLEQATRGLLALNVAVLEEVEKRVGLPILRALQSLQRLGPSLVTELGQDLDLVPSSASRLSDRLTEAGLITRGVAPMNRRATILELTDAGRAILDGVVADRVQRFRYVTEQMSSREREDLLKGATAFTAAYNLMAKHPGADDT